MSEEQWRPVSGWEGLYEVSDQGRVRSLPRTAGSGRRYQGRDLRTPLDGSGYRQVRLSGAGRLITSRVYRLVAAAFLGPAPATGTACHVRHLDDVKTNDTATNLAYGTARDNGADAVRNGRSYWAARTACTHGHPYTVENTRWDTGANGRRFRRCLTCVRATRARAEARRAAA